MDEDKVVMVCAYSRRGKSILHIPVSDVHVDESCITIWDSSAIIEDMLKDRAMSFEIAVAKTEEEMEEIRKQEEKRAKEQFKKMLSKPKRKR